MKCDQGSQADWMLQNP